MTVTPSAQPGSWFSALAAETVEDVLAFAQSFGATYGRVPESGSTADKELNHSSEVGVDGRPWPRQAATMPYDIAGALLPLAIEQYLGSLKLLLAPEMALFGFQAVARSAVEAAARACWVLDPGITARERVVRGALLELESVTESGLSEKAQTGHDAHAQKKMLELRTRMARLGIDEKLNKSKHLIGFASRVLDSKTTAVTKLLPHLGLSVGELWYRTMSGISHSTLYAMVVYLRPDKVDGSGRARPLPELPVFAIANAVVISLDAYLLTIERHAALWGRDAGTVAGKRLQVKGTLLSAAGAAPPGIV